MMTIYIPATVWQALAFLRGRDEIFAGMQDGAARKSLAPLPDLSVSGENLAGYHCRKHAIEAQRARNLRGEMALIEISYGERFHEKLSWEGKINGTGADPLTGAALWVVTPAGCLAINEASKDKPGDVMPAARFVMEVIPEPEATSAQEPIREWGGGPLGNGGC